MPSILQGRGKSAPPPQEAPADDPMAAPMPDQPDQSMGGSRVTLIKNGDGSYTIEHEDGTSDHAPDIGSALKMAAESCGEDPESAKQMMDQGADQSDWSGEEATDQAPAAPEGKDY